MSGLRDLFAVPPIPTGDSDHDRMVRARELYNRELKKGVELGRKLGAFESRYGKLRSYITDNVAKLVVEDGFDQNNDGIRMLRNTVRLMKGKNKI